MATKLAKILPLIKGDWSSGTKYEMLDVVIYNGSSYIAKTESFTSTTNPSADKTNWQLLASKGSNGGDGVKGPKGDKGDQGAVGPTGATGAVGPTGPQGPKGPTGDRGLVGPTGPTGPKGDPGNNGGIGATGPTGPTGPAGANGKDGAPGPAGANGKDGAPGERGPQGLPGANGKDGARGPEGPQGPAGANGKDGAPGANGKDGAAAGFGTPIVNTDNVNAVGTPSVSVSASGPNTAKIFTFTFANLKGEPGANGKDGAPGANGKDGAPGERGLPGANGKDGAPGPQGPTGSVAGVSGSVDDGYVINKLSLNSSKQLVLGTTNTIANANYATSAGSANSVKWEGIPNKPTEFTPSSHTHSIANITNLQNELNGKASSGHTHSSFSSLSISGNIDVGGNLNFTSDKRLKENITTLTDSYLNKVNALDVKKYNYINNKQKQIGFIAQDIESIIPELKDELITISDESKNNGYNDQRFVKETKLIFVLWKAVQELSQEVEKLKRGE